MCLLTAYTDGYNRIIIIEDLEESSSSGDPDLLLTVADDVAVFSISQTCVELTSQLTHGHECFVSTSKPEIIFSSRPAPHSLISSNVGELNHLHNSVPPDK